MIENKICNKCRKELPMTKEFFYSDKGKKMDYPLFVRSVKSKAPLKAIRIWMSGQAIRRWLSSGFILITKAKGILA